MLLDGVGLFRVSVSNPAATGLAQADVFYFGNGVGETGNSVANAIVNSTDELAARSNPRTFLNPATITLPYDFNRDGLVNATDQILARSSATTLATSLKLITVPTAAQAAAAVALEDLQAEDLAAGVISLMPSPTREAWSLARLHWPQQTIPGELSAAGRGAGTVRQELLSQWPALQRDSSPVATPEDADEELEHLIELVASGAAKART